MLKSTFSTLALSALVAATLQFGAPTPVHAQSIPQSAATSQSSTQQANTELRAIPLAQTLQTTTQPSFTITRGRDMMTEVRGNTPQDIILGVAKVLLKSDFSLSVLNIDSSAVNNLKNTTQEPLSVKFRSNNEDSAFNTLHDFLTQSDLGMLMNVSSSSKSDLSSVVIASNAMVKKLMVTPDLLASGAIFAASNGAGWNTSRSAFMESAATPSPSSASQVSLSSIGNQPDSRNTTVFVRAPENSNQRAFGIR